MAHKAIELEDVQLTKPPPRLNQFGYCSRLHPRCWSRCLDFGMHDGDVNGQSLVVAMDLQHVLKMIWIFCLIMFRTDLV